MCVVSMVMDGFQPIIPQPTIPYPNPYPTTFIPWSPPMPSADLEALLAAFKEAVKAAKTADDLTGQKDCADPEKLKLEERVAELERRLAELEKLPVVDEEGIA